MLCTVSQAVHYFQETIDHRLLDISKVLNILSDQKKKTMVAHAIKTA